MSSGAGHILDMINRMKQNKELRTSKRDNLKENYLKFGNSAGMYNKLYRKPLTEEELAQIKIKYAEQAKVQRKKDIIVYLSIIAIVILILCFFIFIIY